MPQQGSRGNTIPPRGLFFIKKGNLIGEEISHSYTEAVGGTMEGASKRLEAER